jgi:hypothetical protein
MQDGALVQERQDAPYGRQDQEQDLLLLLGLWRTHGKAQGNAQEEVALFCRDSKSRQTFCLDFFRFWKPTGRNDRTRVKFRG